MQIREVFSAITLSFILCFSALGQAQAAGSKNEVVVPAEKKKLQIIYDKTIDRSEIISGWFPIAGGQVFPGVSLMVNFAANHRFAGREIKAPSNEFGLLFNHSARSWAFSLHHRLIFQIDGETIDLGDGIYSTKRAITGDGKAAKAGVMESMNFTATREQFEKIAAGKRIEFRLGAFSGILNDEHRQMLRDILNSGMEKTATLNN